MKRIGYSPRKTVFHVAPLLAVLTLTGCAELLAPMGAPGEPTQVSQSADGEALVQFGGASNVVVLDGDRAWLGLGPRVVGLDVARPEAPVILAQSPVLPGVVVGLAPDPARGLVWAALGKGGVAALQAIEGAGLSIVRQVDLGIPARDIAVEGEHVYVASDPAELVVLDTAGTVVARYAPPHFSYAPPLPFGEPRVGLELREGMAFLSNVETGLNILDVSDPAAPRQVGHLDMSSQPMDVILDGDLAYLTGFPLSIVDISAPAHPRMVWPKGIETGEGMVVSSVAVDQGLWVSNDRLIDVRSPERPVMVADFSPGGDGVAYSRPAVRDGIAYLPAAQWEGGLRILDVSDPAEPRELWRVSAPGSVWEVLASEGQLDVLGTLDTTTLDVRDPAEPRVLERSVDPADPRRERRRVQAIDAHVYVADDRKLRVLAAGQVQGVPPAAATPIFTLPIQSNPTEMVRQGDYLYLTDSGWEYDIQRPGPYYFEVVDLSDAERPRVAAGLEFPYPLYAIAVAGDTAWVSQPDTKGHTSYTLPGEPDPPGEIVAIDISDPTAPFVRDRVGAKSAVNDVLIAGSTLYAATDLGWQTFDVGDGTRLEPGELRPLPGRARQLALADGILWIANDDAGVVGVPVGPLAPDSGDATPRLPVFAGEEMSIP